MHAEHHALKQVGALTIQDTSLYQANLIQQADVHAQTEEQVKTNILSALTDSQEHQI